MGLFWLSDYEWGFINELILVFYNIVGRHSVPSSLFSCRNFVSVFQDCNFLFIHYDSYLHICPWNKGPFFLLREAMCLSCACMPWFLHASTYTSTHVPTPCSLPSQSLSLPLHAPFSSILFSLKPPYWPSPSNRMIIWHNVTPPWCMMGAVSQLHPPLVPVAGVWGWRERKMGLGGWIYFRGEKREFHAHIVTWLVSTS